MPTILKLPRGLSALLGLRAGGATPQDLADVVAGVVDFTPLYLLDTREWLQATIQPNPVLGTNSWGAAFVVPPGELWYLWHYLVSASPGAGEQIDIAPAFLPDGLPATIPLGDYVNGTAGQNTRSYLRAPVWCGPGTELAFLVRSLTLQPDVTGAAIITRLRI